MQTSEPKTGAATSARAEQLRKIEHPRDTDMRTGTKPKTKAQEVNTRKISDLEEAQNNM
jgi:hypothetical protein